MHFRLAPGPVILNVACPLCVFIMALGLPSAPNEYDNPEEAQVLAWLQKYDWAVGGLPKRFSSAEDVAKETGAKRNPPFETWLEEGKTITNVESSLVTLLLTKDGRVDHEQVAHVIYRICSSNSVPSLRRLITAAEMPRYVRDLTLASLAKAATRESLLLVSAVALVDSDAGMRANACSELRGMERSRVEETLLVAATDPDEQVRKAARAALVALRQ